MTQAKLARPSKSTNVRVLLNFLIQRTLIRAGFPLAPRRAAERAARLFLRPLRPAPAGRSGYVSRETPPFSLDGSLFAAELPDGSPVAGWSFGQAGNPAILLVHGWEDDHLSWLPLIDRLLARGYRVIAMDLPGHGRSPGALTPIPVMAAGVAAIGREAAGIGAAPFHATIAHSMGGTVTVLAAAEMGLQTGRLALLAPPNHPRLFAAAMMKMLKLDEQQTAQVFAAIEGIVGRSMDSLYLPPLLRRLDTPGLILHSRDDRLVPLQHSRENAAAWRTAEFRMVDGLGHRRLLSDEGVHSMLLHFLASDAPADAFGRPAADAAD
jgi:pimeloyl-ACP methyl ester carboxylesterase